MVKVHDGKSDPCLLAIAAALGKYQERSPSAEIEVYRQNSASVRIRVVDPGFEGVSKADRHDLVWEFIKELPEEQQSEISFLLLLTPQEKDGSFANFDFEHPARSRL